MIFARHVLNNVALQEAVSAAHWLPGRTWGSTNTTLHIEQRFDPPLYDALGLAGHDIEQVGDFEKNMRYAGAFVFVHGLSRFRNLAADHDTSDIPCPPALLHLR
jgi:hypothetical protein